MSGLGFSRFGKFVQHLCRSLCREWIAASTLAAATWEETMSTHWGSLAWTYSFMVCCGGMGSRPWRFPSG